VNFHGKICGGSEPTGTICDNNKSLSVYLGSTDYATGIQFYNNTVNDTFTMSALDGALIHDNTWDYDATTGNDPRNWINGDWWKGVQFYNNTFTGNGNDGAPNWKIGLEVFALTHNTKIYNNTTDMWFSIVELPPGYTSAHVTPWAFQVYNNDFISTSGTCNEGAIEIADGYENVRVYNNYFTGPDWGKAIYMNCSYDGVGANSDMKNIQIYNNIMYNVGTTGSDRSVAVHPQGGGGGNSGDWDDIYVVNNITVGSNDDAIQVEFKGGTNYTLNNLYIDNNIIMDCSVGIWLDIHSGNSSGLYARNNCFSNNTTNITEAGSASFTQSGNITAAPGWNGSGSRSVRSSANYHYPTDDNSNLYDAGASHSGMVDDDYAGTSRPQGSAWDIGVFELAEGHPDVNESTGTNEYNKMQIPLDIDLS
jgi:hypothetical protein